MITLEEALLMGTNAPWSHQRAITALASELYFLYKKQCVISLEPLAEAMLNEDQTSPVPDILLYDAARAEIPVIIEITHTLGVKSDMKKVRALIDEDDYGIEEGFVYNYKKNEWHKYAKGIGDVSEQPSFSTQLNLDLAALLSENNP
jgi:Uma2 family endonuclease